MLTQPFRGPYFLTKPGGQETDPMWPKMPDMWLLRVLQATAGTTGTPGTRTRQELSNGSGPRPEPRLPIGPCLQDPRRPHLPNPVHLNVLTVAKRATLRQIVGPNQLPPKGAF